MTEYNQEIAFEANLTKTKITSGFIVDQQLLVDVCKTD